MKKYLYKILFAVLLFSLSFQSDIYAQSNLSKYTYAKELIEKRQYNEAVTILRDILKNEESAYIYKTLAETLVYAKKFEEALEELNKAVAKYPDDSELLYLSGQVAEFYLQDLGKAYSYYNQASKVMKDSTYSLSAAAVAEKLGKHKDALKIFNSLIEEDSDNSTLYLYRGLLYQKMKKDRNAVKDIKKAVEKDENNITAKLVLADIYINKGDDKEAIKILEELSKGNEYFSDIINSNLGKIYVRNRDYIKAIEVYKKLSEKLYGRNKALVLKQLGDVLIEAGKYDEAAKTFEEASALQEEDTLSLIVAGRLYEYLKKYNDAERMYLKVLKIDPLYSQVLKRITVVYLLQDKADEALKYIQQVDEVEQDVDYFILLAECYTVKKEYAKSIKILEGGLVNNPTSQQILYYLASLYEQNKQREKSIEAIRKALNIEPNNHTFQNFLGYMYAEMGVNLDEAMQLIKKALEQEPKNAAYLDSLGWVYYKKKDMKKAYKYIKEAYNIMPNDDEIKSHYNTIKRAVNKK